MSFRLFIHCDKCPAKIEIPHRMNNNAYWRSWWLPEHGWLELQRRELPRIDGLSMNQHRHLCSNCKQTYEVEHKLVKCPNCGRF